jgi:HlyD family secretion protein
MGGGSDTWLRVDRRDLVMEILTEGELRAVDSALIGPPQLRRLWNEKARRDLDIQRRQLELRLEEARARLRQTELRVGQSAEITAAIELEKARIDKRVAEAEIESLGASLQQHSIRSRMESAILQSKLEFARTKVADQRDAIQRMTVKAPRGGTLILRSDWRGQKKQVGDRVWRADKVLEIPDLSRMEASAEVDERSAGRLAEGQPVTFRLDAYPDREYRAVVGLIRRAVQVKSWQNPSKIVKLTLELEETDTERMRPGMRFVGNIAAQTIPGAVSVPSSCVTSDAKGAYVEVRKLLGRRKVYPELGRRNDEYVEVLSGLEIGDRVLRRSGEEAGA